VVFAALEAVSLQRFTRYPGSSGSIRPLAPHWDGLYHLFKVTSVNVLPKFSKNRVIALRLAFIFFLTTFDLESFKEPIYVFFFLQNPDILFNFVWEKGNQRS